MCVYVCVFVDVEKVAKIVLYVIICCRVQQNSSDADPSLLKVSSLAHVLHAFVNGALVGKLWLFVGQFQK